MTEGLTMTCGEKLLEQGRMRGRAEGKLEGKLETAISSVLRVLEARGLPVSEAQRSRVEDCRNVDTLERWLRAAVTAESTEAALR
ncbi:MAG: hypothetical protein ACE37F_03225 [Nannocystaceae bacterium]|nr:hypothetical protein [bacterium]